MTADASVRTSEQRGTGRTGSPLESYVDRFAELAAATGGAVRIAEQSLLAQITLRTDPANTVLGGPLPPLGKVTRSNGIRILGLGPDEWLIVGPPGAQEHLQDELGGLGAVVDVSGQRTVVALSGPKSRELLAKGCALDLHPRVFFGDRCAQTNLARAQVILMAHQDVPDSYWLLVRSSFARYVADWLLDAALEYHFPESGL